MGLLDVLLPPACAGCGRFGHVVCNACQANLRLLSDGRDEFLAADPGIVVGDGFVLAAAAFPHRDEAKRILRCLKYGGGRSLAGPLAGQALPAFRALLAISGHAPLVPVPLHRARHRERGYNQASLLAEALARATSLEVWPAIARRRSTQRQHGLDRATRLRNLRNAMAYAPPVPGRDGPRALPETVILVDDILTTGATFEACAAILRAAGIRAVYGFAIAREV